MPLPGKGKFLDTARSWKLPRPGKDNMTHPGGMHAGECLTDPGKGQIQSEKKSWRLLLAGEYDILKLQLPGERNILEIATYWRLLDHENYCIPEKPTF